ncbi:hypothetical protein J4Q44_G00283380 [Coregonus suidteri]|uniref:Ig-like domain-containing protein n=1 Tax=Coregonus suidteri TaxID=861788 RepID=A0AAN8L368_9TELE
MCRSQTEAGRVEGRARVFVLEKLKFTPTPQPSQCLELDKESTVQCSAKGRETPTIQWTKADGSQLSEHVVQTGGVLTFAKVTRDDAGNYTCLASNSLQGQITASVRHRSSIPPLTLVALMPTTPMQVTDTPQSFHLYNQTHIDKVLRLSSSTLTRIDFYL